MQKEHNHKVLKDVEHIDHLWIPYVFLWMVKESSRWSQSFFIVHWWLGDELVVIGLLLFSFVVVVPFCILLVYGLHSIFVTLSNTISFLPIKNPPFIFLLGKITEKIMHATHDCFCVIATSCFHLLSIQHVTLNLFYSDFSFFKLMVIDHFPTISMFFLVVLWWKPYCLNFFIKFYLK